MSDDPPDNLRPVADFFGLPSMASVAKDFYVVRAIKALAAIDTTPFSLVFAGGTALARAHKLVRRMSEDVDFKAVPMAAAPVSASALRKRLGRLRDEVSAALLKAGFSGTADRSSKNENRYTLWQLPYATAGDTGQGLRPTIQIEVTYAPLRLPPVTMPISSFVTEAFDRPPDVAAISCVSLVETAAEKLVSLTRRTAMELAGLSRDPDPTLVRHIYDLHALSEHIDPLAVADLAREIATADAAEFRNQYPAYAADIAGETKAAIAAICTDPAYRRRYDDFMAAMVYGERPGFDVAVAIVLTLAGKMIRHEEAV